MFFISTQIDYVDDMGFAFNAVSGEDFLKSAWYGFLINLKHSQKFQHAQSTGNFFISSAIFLITALTGLIFIFSVLIYNPENIDYIHAFFVVLLTALVFTQTFLGLFQDAIRAMLMSYVIDLDLNNGKAQNGPQAFYENLRDIKGEEE